MKANLAASQAIEALINGGSRLFEPARQLPRLVPVGQAVAAHAGASAHRLTLARLIRALRAERQRGRAGHWTYDLNRHIALMQAYTAEKRVFAAQQDRDDVT